MSSVVPADDGLIAEVERYSWRILLLLLIVSLIFFSPRVMMGVLTGGLICIFNFRWLKSFTRRILSAGTEGRAKGIARFGYILRYIAVGVIIYTVLKTGIANPLSTLVGISVVFMSITFVAVKKTTMNALRRRN